MKNIFSTNAATQAIRNCTRVIIVNRDGLLVLLKRRWHKHQQSEELLRRGHGHACAARRASDPTALRRQTHTCWSSCKHLYSAPKRIATRRFLIESLAQAYTNR